MKVIQTVDLTKQFGDFTANDQINLSVEQQEIKCIVGENGAGKSTLMNMLYGLLKPTSGKILIKEKEVDMNSPIDAIKNGIGMVHQHFKLVPSLTVYENILLGAEIVKRPFIDSADCRADAIIVTGSSIGLETPIEMIEKAKKVVKIPVLAGSGINCKNIAEQMKIADGAIIGSSLKKDGILSNPISYDLVRELMSGLNR